MGNKIKSRLLEAILFGLFFFIIECFGGIYIGPLSPRQYLIILAGIYLLFNYRFLNKIVFKPVRFLFAYYIYVLFLGFVSDLYTSHTGVIVVFARMLPAIVIYYFTLLYIKSFEEFKMVIYIILAIVVVDSGITILQGQNNPIGWGIATVFSADKAAVLENAYNLDMRGGSSIDNSVTMGIMSTVVANGYFLSSFGLMFIFPFLINPNKWTFIVSTFVFTIVTIALFYNQQRSAFAIYLLMSAFLWIKLLFNGKKIIYLILISVVAIVLLLSTNFDSIELGRFENISSTDITERNHNFYSYFSSYFWEHPFLGQFAKYEASHDGVTPHNLFAEATLQGGIIGLIIFALFLLNLFIDMLKCFKRGKVMSILFIFPILSVILVSFTHSSGFHTGMSSAISLLAFYVVSKKYENHYCPEKIRYLLIKLHYCPEKIRYLLIKLFIFNDLRR